MDWVVSKIRQWLGLEAELVALQARLTESEKRIENLRKANEVCIGNLDTQISQLRSAFTAANEQRPRATVTAKNWVHAKLLMGEEIDV